jgi:hypothetical protein
VPDASANGVTIDAQYDLPNGDKVWVIDTETVGQRLRSPEVTAYHLIFDEDLRQDINRLSAEYKRNPESAAGQEYVAVINALKALQSGRENAYEGEQLRYGPQSHDLRDCAELKVQVVRERGGVNAEQQRWRRRGVPLGLGTGSGSVGFVWSERDLRAVTIERDVE